MGWMNYSRWRWLPMIPLLAVLLPFTHTPARADAVDGGWCYTDGRRLTIDGPQIVTPGGSRIEGDYQHHSFTYTIPKKEPGGGMIAHIEQLDEGTMHMSYGPGGGDGKPVETWHRCSKETS